LKSRLSSITGLLLIGCSLFAQSQIVADFKSDITGGCSPVVINFQDLSSGNPTTWSWDFGNGATSTKQHPSTTYFDVGTYVVKLTASDASRSHTVTKLAYITVYRQPTVDFTATKKSGCSPVVVQFSDASSSPSGTTVKAWKWDFGDGNSSTAQNPQHIYRNAGSYTVTLTITNNLGCTQLITKPNYVDVSAGVVPGFNYSDPAVCSAPATINFVNTSTGPGTLTYNWDFGNGSVATTPNASTIYNKNGTYRVSLFVSSSSGCSDTAVTYIKVGKANTDFKTPVSLCANTPLQFLNNSSPRPIKSFWRFSTGATDTFRNAITSFPGPGTYTITLVNTYTECTDSITKTITLLPNSVIDFTAVNPGKCQVPSVINFTSNTTGSSYLWNFGDGGTSLQKNPSYTYKKAGIYDVSLVITTANGCRDSLKKKSFINIGKPSIKFKNLPAEGCIPHLVNFGADVLSADSVASYKWSFGDGSSSTLKNPDYTYTKAGIYAVSLTVTTTSGCTQFFKMDSAVMVDTMIKPDFTSIREACASPGIQFTNLTKDPRKEFTYLWTFSDGTTSTQINPSVTFSDTGWIDASLEVKNRGCKNKITKIQYAYLYAPISKFAYEAVCTDPLQYTFTDKSIGAKTWEWKFGDGTAFIGQNPPPHVFPSLGIYKVSLTTTNGNCSYTANKEIIITANKPDFIAAIREGCKAFTANIQGIVANSGLIKKYIWDFGDGAGQDTTQGITARYTYLRTGVYDVSLTVIDSFGCTQSIKKNAYIKVGGPEAEFISDSKAGCKGTATTFIDATTTDGINKIVKWTWNFGDSTTQTYTAPPFQHVYDSVGDYDVELIVTDAMGCRDTVNHRGFVMISTIKAQFGTTGAICDKAPLYFGSTTLSDLPYTLLWNFGDGQTSTLGAVEHTYTDTGIYTVQLKVRDLMGCEDSVSNKNIQVSRPKASFTENNLISYCTPFQALFTNKSSFYNSSYWDFGFGTSTQNNPSSYYTQIGQYPVKLVVTGPGGCKDSTSKVLNVYDPREGKLNYFPLTGCRPLNVNLEAFSQYNANFVWDFGDGNINETSINKLIHTYNDAGDFIPKIIVKQPDGCVLTIKGTDTIQIFGAKAKFNLLKNQFCDSGYINIIDSTITRDSILSYKWDFGDGTTSNQLKPGHYYYKPGNYPVSLIVSTEKGCIDTARINVKVIQSPLISVKTDTVICVNETLLHMGIMERADSSLVKWRWTFPNGNTSGYQNPDIQQYNTAGLFQLNAIATNSSGCADTVTRNILVNPIPVINLPATLTKMVGVPLLIPATYSNNILRYLWSPANTLSCAGCPQPFSNTKFNTQYNIAVIDSNGCQNSSSIEVIVTCQGSNIFVPNTFSPNGDGANDVFMVRGNGLNRIKTLRVFNRWGEVMFEQKEFPANNALYGWNGIYKGKKALPDVYIYQVEIYCENGEIMRFDGNVALIQ